MKAKNFTVREAIYIVCGGRESDLHNWYAFRSFTYDVQTRELRLIWAKRDDDRILREHPSKLILAFQQVSSLEIQPRDPKLPFTEDDCLANIGYISKELGIPGVFASDKKPDDEWKWVFDFMSGAQVVMQAKTVEAITEPEQSGGEVRR